MPLPFVTVDAFTSVRFRGNPAAVVLLPRSSDPENGSAELIEDGTPGGTRMQGFPLDGFLADVAKEMNLSETAFVKPRGPRDDDDDDAFDLRWFTRDGTEVDLCGHATLATAHALWSTGATPSTRTLRFHTRGGELTVRPLGDGLAEMDFPSAPPTLDRLDAAVTPQKVAAALTLPGDVAPRIVGSNAVGDIFAVFDEAEDVLRARPNAALVAALGGRGLVATAAGGTGEGGADVDFTSRFFGPNIGIEEDPVTGSSFCGLAPYWTAELGVEPGAELVGYQASARGGTVRVAVRRQPTRGGEGDAGTERVAIRGHAVTVVRGEVL